MMKSPSATAVPEYIPSALLKESSPGHDVALFYGFTSLPPLAPTRSDSLLAKKIAESVGASRGKEVPFSDVLEEKIALLRKLQELEIHRSPLPAMVHIVRKENSDEYPAHVDLDVIGTSKSIAEAILIKTAVAILKEEGYGDLELYVNSVGDRDSLLRFTRELGNFFKKHHERLQQNCRGMLKRDVFELMYCPHDKCAATRHDAPKSISFLSEPSRQHLKEFLEYVEMFDMPYKIHHPLVGHRAFCSQTLFELRPQGTEASTKPLAIGLRYDYLGRRLGFKRELPSAGVRVFLKTTPKLSKPAKFKNPKLCFFHLGFEARLKSLTVIEMLREAGLPVFHALSRDKLGSQIGAAQEHKYNVPYTLIMGQKEALEHTVIVRNTTTREQESVPIPNLVAYLKNIL